MACLTYRGECINTAYAWAPEREDLLSPLIRRCAQAMELGADDQDVIELCLQAGQTPPEAQLTYLAGKLLSRWRENS